MALHVPTSRYLRLNRRASDILGLLAMHGGPDDALRVMVEQHGLAREEAEAELEAVLGPFETVTRRSPAPKGRATPMEVVRAGARWLRLPPRDLFGTAVAGVVLAVGEHRLRTADVNRTARLLGVPLSFEERPVAPNGDVGSLTPTERRRVRQAEWVLARWRYPATCLRRSLLIGFFLRSRRPVLRLGLLPDGQTAHAWVEAGGRSYWGLEGLTPFTAMGGAD